MKVGDLVQVKLGTGVYEHRKLFGEVGIVLCIATSWGLSLATVYIMGKQKTISLKHLEVVNENR
jgi:hypothetical protein